MGVEKKMKKLGMMSKICFLLQLDHFQIIWKLGTFYRQLPTWRNILKAYLHLKRPKQFFSFVDRIKRKMFVPQTFWKFKTPSCGVQKKFTPPSLTIRKIFPWFLQVFLTRKLFISQRFKVLCRKDSPLFLES